MKVYVQNFGILNLYYFQYLAPYNIEIVPSSVTISRFSQLSIKNQIIQNPEEWGSCANRDKSEFLYTFMLEFYCLCFIKNAMRLGECRIQMTCQSGSSSGIQLITQIQLCLLLLRQKGFFSSQDDDVETNLMLQSSCSADLKQFMDWLVFKLMAGLSQMLTVPFFKEIRGQSLQPHCLISIRSWMDTDMDSLNQKQQFVAITRHNRAMIMSLYIIVC